MTMFRIIAVVFFALASPTLGQVDIPEGYEIVEFSVNDRMTRQPAMNDCGEIVYVKDRFEDSRVYLYDNGKITRLTDYNEGRGVAVGDINNSGTIVWNQAFRQQPQSSEIVVWQDGKESILDEGRLPVVNNVSHMAWQSFRQVTCNFEQDIMYFDGVNITAITANRLNNQGVQINNHDWIVWYRGDFCVNPWVSDVLLFVDGTVEVLPSTDTQNHTTDVNDFGQVVWGSKDGIHLWENGVTRLLTDWSDGGSVINNQGDVFFFRWHDELDSTDAWMYRNRDGEERFHRLTEDDLEDTVGGINDWGEAAWRWMRDPPRGDFSGGIRYLRRARTGDGDFDGDVDLDDAAMLHACMTGPIRTDRLCDCRFLDIDHDGDVDLADFTRLQAAFARD